MDRSAVGFGTSGARGLVSSMTDSVCFAYTVGYLRHLERCGEFGPGTSVALAGDLRPSTPRIMRACLAAILFMGGTPIYCGHVPTPALCVFAFSRRIPSLMVTGSHIPDDRNGIKFNRLDGEFMKSDEAGMLGIDVAIPAEIFDRSGALLEPPPLPEPTDVLTGYRERYVGFFGREALSGFRIAFYQHSGVGRDFLPGLLEALGAEVLVLGRSAQFVPVDTEAVREADRRLAREWAQTHEIDAIVTTDGDADRPLVADESGAWLRGDILGLVTARFLGAGSVTTPVNSNTALEAAAFARRINRTRIGSPFVIQDMMRAENDGIRPSVGYEANGGFLLASPVERDGHVLSPLPTRDAVLPILSVLLAAREQGGSLRRLQQALPQRFTLSDRVAPLPSAVSLETIRGLRERIEETTLVPGLGAERNRVLSVDETDGLRLFLSGGDILHLRPSGNAPELRIYVEASAPERAFSLLEEARALVAPAS